VKEALEKIRLFQLTDGIAKTVMVAIENLPDPEDPTPSWGFARIN
jgi:hypothetical protein